MAMVPSLGCVGADGILVRREDRAKGNPPLSCALPFGWSDFRIDLRSLPPFSVIPAQAGIQGFRLLAPGFPLSRGRRSPLNRQGICSGSSAAAEGGMDQQFGGRGEGGVEILSLVSRREAGEPRREFR